VIRAVDKIVSLEQLREIVSRLRAAGKQIVFTNGCFDLLHTGHVRYLQKARSEGDILIVAINSDRSVRKLKGRGRPILPELERAEILGALQCVDHVTIFEQDTPLQVIECLRPNVLVKGGDWKLDQIVGREVVEADGGRVISIAFEEGKSTTNILNHIRTNI
jgi:D-beta-D-heptose 7-phosphate kinase/D-beta-D-heptose 1-phosphate adenosyltransferase